MPEPHLGDLAADVEMVVLALKDTGDRPVARLGA
jgi:hypothetical protein